MDRSRAGLLITELGQRIGAKGMALDGSGRCLLSIDGGAVVVSIRHDERAGTLELTTGLDELELSAERLAKALAANFCWRPADGATFSLDRFTRRLVLRRICAGDGLDVVALMTALDRFVKHTIAWTRILSDIDTQAEKAAAPAGERRPMPLAQVRA